MSLMHGTLTKFSTEQLVMCKAYTDTCDIRDYADSPEPPKDDEAISTMYPVADLEGVHSLPAPPPPPPRS